MIERITNLVLVLGVLPSQRRDWYNKIIGMMAALTSAPKIEVNG